MSEIVDQVAKELETDEATPLGLLSRLYLKGRQLEQMRERWNATPLRSKVAITAELLRKLPVKVGTRKRKR